MKSLEAADFRKRCLSLLDNLDAEGLLITLRGRPVARVTPYAEPAAVEIGSLRDKVEVRGEVLTTGVDWGVTHRA